MKSLVSILSLSSLLLSGMARAEERCAVAMVNWQPREAVLQLAQQNGWQVRRIRIDDGCYEVLGTDASGRKIDVKLHPGTLAIVENGHKEEHDTKKHGDD
jgi:hypothetical protein